MVGNEYNTAFSVVGSNLRLTDGGGNIDVPLTSLGTDDQNAGEVAVTPAGNITATEVQSALEELDAAILSGQLTTTVAAGTGIDVSSTTVGNNTEYTVTVDPTDIIGDGGITSGDIDVTGGANSTLNDVGLTIADNDDHELQDGGRCHYHGRTCDGGGGVWRDIDIRSPRWILRTMRWPWKNWPTVPPRGR